MRRPIRRWIFPFALLLARAGALRAQAPDTGAISFARATVVHSYVLDEDRPILVRLPDSYESNVGDRYPVLFLLDGKLDLLQVSGIEQQLEANLRIPGLIVVAIPNTRDRTHDLTPPAVTVCARVDAPAAPDSLVQCFRTAGGAPRFLAFLTDELIPWVERTYRALPYRVLVGHSFGGLFVLYALAARPDAFQAYLAVSPSLWWDEERFERTLERSLRSSTALRGRLLYMTTGSLEGSALIDPARRLADTLEQARPAGFRAWFRLMPGETHGSNSHRSIYDGLEMLFSDWAVPDSVELRAAYAGDLGPLDKHYAGLSSRLGMKLGVPEAVLTEIGMTLLGRGHVPEAIRVLRRNVSDHPESPHAYDRLAVALEVAGHLDDALKAEEESVRLAGARRDAEANAYRQRLDRLRARTGR